MTRYNVRLRWHDDGHETTLDYEALLLRALALIMLAPYVDVLEIYESTQ